MKRILGSVVTILALAALAAPASHADILAAVCVESGGNRNIAVLNVATGARRTLPAGVNTSEREFNPSISSDGRRLAFQRRVPAGGSRLIVTDLATGQSSDLFDAFETAGDPIHLSSISPSGSRVATGRNHRSVLSGFFQPRVTLTSLQSFPSGPFARSTIPLSRIYPSPGFVESVASSDTNLFALHARANSPLRGEIVLTHVGGTSSAVVRSATFSYTRPALAASNPDQVVFVEQDVSRGTGTQTDIVFRPAIISGFAGTPTKLLSGVSTAADTETLPALTADGRYVGFVRGFEPGFVEGRNDRLFVFDSVTRTFLNPNGINLGYRGSDSLCGSASIYQEPVLASTVITSAGNVNATLLGASSIGIFVQRILGKTQVLGRKAFELETIGRVPLGSFGEGNVFTHWDFAVNGEPLGPGRYLVTLRAVDEDDEGPVVRELAEPQVLRIDKDGSIHMQGEDR
jgi:hypothetical protein